MNRLPNFLIVGAAKSGTTSLFEYLRSHPEVFGPAHKEPAYFAKSVPHRVKDLDAYQALFSSAGDAKCVGEASVAYFHDPDAAGEILETLGSSTKIIIILRNPVDMMYSLWGQLTRVGAETLSFDEALDAAATRDSDEPSGTAADNRGRRFAYLERATYAPQANRYLERFGRENVLILIYEEFFADPRAGYADVCDFLGVSKLHQPEFLRHNPAGTVRSKFLRAALNEQFVIKTAYKQIVPLGIRQRMRDLLEMVNRRSRPLARLTAAQREHLAASFVDDVRELERILERPLADIWQIGIDR